MRQRKTISDDSLNPYCQSGRPKSEAWLCLVLCEKASGKSIGVTGFFMDKGIAEVGYLLLPEFHGKQCGTESLKALL
jgi:RimJ/RimL family protein N-acetyltransferase